MQALLETQASRVPQEQLDSLHSPEPQASLVCSSMHADAKSYIFSGCCALHTSTLFFQQYLSERFRAYKFLWRRLCMTLGTVLATGASGATGFTGSTGVTGYTGATGFSGDTGAPSLHVA